MKKLFFLLALLCVIVSCEYQDNGVTSIDDVITSQYLIDGIANNDLDEYVQNNQIFRYTGKPGLVEIPIGKDNLKDFESCFVLYVSSGPDPKTTVSSAIITLDGMEVLNTSDFSKNSGLYSFEVCNLTPTSTIKIEVRGEPGTYVNVWIEGKLKLPTEGLVAYYPLDGNAKDYSGYGNDGTIIGGVTSTVDRNGNPDKALDFNGVDGYIYIPNSESLQSPLSGITISGWVNIKEFNPPFGHVTILAKTVSSDFYGQYHFMYHEWLNTSWYLFLSGNGSVFSGAYATLTEPLKYGVWYFIATTWDGVVGKIYLNGNLVGIYYQAGEMTADNNPVVIGRNTPGYWNHYTKGKIDNVRLYNRALTQEEITALYNE